MLNIGSAAYSPVLRLKEGEYKGLPQLPTDILARVFPFFIIPPPKEHDPELQRPLTASELVLVPAQRLGRWWPRRPCMFEPRFLFKKLGPENAIQWLPELFRIAIAAHAKPIPVSDIRTLEGSAFEAIHSVVRDITHNLALRVTLDDLTRADLQSRIHTVLLRLALKPQDCALVLDFGKADMTDPAAVGDILVAELQKVMDFGIWGQVVWHATSYPEKNPAVAGQTIELPRNEWIAWQRAIELDAELEKNLMYGDFAADSSKFNFSSGSVAPIRHYRYSTPEHWVVIRASDMGSTKDAMKEVATRLVASVHFAGRTFSLGDKYISDTAADKDGPGNATTWRRVNTVHHITRVVTDLGPQRGYRIIERVETPEPEQQNLFR